MRGWVTGQAKKRVECAREFLQFREYFYILIDRAVACPMTNDRFAAESGREAARQVGERGSAVSGMAKG